MLALEAGNRTERGRMTTTHGGVLRDAMCADDSAVAGSYFGTRTGSVFASRNEGDSWSEVARGAGRRAAAPALGRRRMTHPLWFVDSDTPVSRRVGCRRVHKVELLRLTSIGT
jgi:hypothetical protein